MLFSSNYRLVFIQIVLLVLGGLLIFNGLSGFYDLLVEEVVEEKSNQILVGIMQCLIGLLLIIGGVYLWDRIRVVKLTNTEIILFKSNSKVQAEWLEVEYIYKIIVLPKHTYRIKLISEEKSYLFYNEYDSIWSILSDDSPVGKLIQKRKRELDI